MEFKNNRGEAARLEPEEEREKLKESEKILRLEKRTAERESQAKSEFNANIMHDIRSPLTGMVGLASHLAEKIESPKEKEYPKVIHERSEQLLGLLNTVLNAGLCQKKQQIYNLSQ